MPFCPICGYSMEPDASFCLSCGANLSAPYPSETTQLSIEKGNILEGQQREVILLDRKGVSLQSIVKRALGLEETSVQAISQKSDPEAKVGDFKAEISRLLAEVEVLKKSSVRIQQLEEEVMELAARKAELEEKLRTLEAERDELKEEIQELEEKVAITELEARITELQTEIRELGEKKKQLEEKLPSPETSSAA